MEIGSKTIPNKALSIAGKIIPIAAGIQGFTADATADGRGWRGAIPFMVDRLKRWKLPSNLGFWTYWLTSDEGMQKYPVIPGAGVGLAGYFMKEVDINPITNKIGGILQSAGGAQAAGAATALFLFMSAENPHGSSTSQGYSSGVGTRQGTKASRPDTIYQSRGGAQFRTAPGANILPR